MNNTPIKKSPISSFNPSPAPPLRRKSHGEATKNGANHAERDSGASTNVWANSFKNINITPKRGNDGSPFNEAEAIEHLNLKSQSKSDNIAQLRKSTTIAPKE